MKLKSLIVSILILQAFIQPSLVAYSDQVLEIQKLSDMLEQVEAIDIQFTGDDSQGHFSYTVLGTEAVDNKPSWKVETVFGESGEDESYTIWVDKATGKTLKADFEGEVITGTFAELYGNITLAFFMGFVYNYWQSWTYQEVLEWDNAEVGTATSLGKQVQTFGPTTLETWGIRYEGYTMLDETINYQSEVWYAPTQFGGIMTYMSITATGQESYNVELELKSIILVEDQQVPSDFIELIEGQTVPEPTSTPTPTPTPTPEPDEEKQSGGIPGFPIPAILISVMIIIALNRKNNKL